MKKVMLFSLLALMVVAGTAVAEEGGQWVTAKGKVHKLDGSAQAIFVTDENAERFNLSDLNDGETRIFGAGARAVTVSRSGDEAQISRTSSGDDVSAIDIVCQLDTDNCTVMTFPDDPEKVMVAIEKERVCVNGEGDCDLDFDQMGVHGEAHVIVEIDCDGEDCDELHTMELDELHEGLGTFVVETEDVQNQGQQRIMVKRMAPGASGHHGLQRVHSNRTMLRCTHGDATLTVSLEEADDTFLCPKHSTPMEKVEHGQGGVKVIRVNPEK